jgi:ABC-type Zn uptake system ZnuABC Zn-binding protein ZnuA
LEDSIRELDVKAVFVGNTVNPVLAERLAADTGTQLVFVYTGSLTEQGAEADSYLDYIRYNVSAIVDALK